MVAAPGWRARLCVACALLRSVAALSLQEHAVSIRARHYSSAGSAGVERPLARVGLETLTSASEERNAWLQALRRDHVALVALDDTDAETMRRLWAATGAFFEVDAAARAGLAFREADTHTAHKGQSRAAGYTEVDGNLFLDTRLRAGLEGVEAWPAGLDAGLDRALVDAEAVLAAVGFAALGAATADLPVDVAGLAVDVGALVDRAPGLDPGVTSASVHRLVRYDAAAAGEAVLFQPHTDGTWFTLVPVAQVPGLEVHSGGAWLRPEAQGNHGTDVAVLSGEFLHVLTDGFYPAALHRVVSAPSVRTSAPLLFRAAPASGFSGGARDGTLLGHVHASLAGDDGPAAAAPPPATPLDRIAQARAYAASKRPT